MQELSLSALKRELFGKKARHEYQGKRIPGIVYGGKQKPLAISADKVEISKLYQEAGTNKIIDLKIEGEDKPIKVLFHEVQTQPTTNEIIHFDVYAITLGKKLRTEIPIHIIGDAPASVKGEGTLATLMDAVEVEANPLNLPEGFDVNIEGLDEVGKHVTVADISVPEGVEILAEPEEIIAKIDPIVEEEEEEEETELAEGEEAEETKKPEEESGEESEESSEKDSEEQ